MCLGTYIKTVDLGTDTTVAFHPRARQHLRHQLFAVLLARRSLSHGLPPTDIRNERKNLDCAVLRRRVRLPGHARRTDRRRDQRFPRAHETARENQLGRGVEERSSLVQPSQMFPERGPMRATGQRHEE